MKDENSHTDQSMDDVIIGIDREYAYRRFTDWKRYLVIVVSVVFSLFQLYAALTGSIPAQLLRASHLAFVVFLGYLLYPLTQKSAKNTWPWYDMLLAVAAAGSWIYIVVNFSTLVTRAGAYTTLDVVIGAVGILTLFELCRRIVGLPIMIIAGAFILYALFGKYMPGFLNHRGYSVTRVISHLFYNTEGIMGTPIGVCASFIFLFILFGAFLEKTGVGKFFIDICNALAGWASGGPAKVAVLASALQGTVSGSSVSNTVGTGSFTIPMMKSLGYKPEFAAAVEAAASTGGQIMPPIMGAAAFLMAESLGMPYIEVAKAAIIPALLYFTGVFVMVHLEAKKNGLTGLSKEAIPHIGKILKERGHLILPLVAIIYFLVSGYTATRAALMGLFAAVAIGLVTSLYQYFTKKPVDMKASDFVAALVDGARNLLSVAVACGMAGIIIGIVTLTGLGLKIGAGLVSISGGVMILTLFFTMVTSLILGMGAPTTANYLITSTITAPALIKLGVIPLAAHMFAFYFGIIADVTPPVALAAMAGAAIAKAKPMQSAFNATKLAIAAFIIPYIFVFSPSLLLVATTPLEIAQIIVTSLIGMVGVGAALEGWLLHKCNVLERLLLAAAGLSLIIPEIYTDIAGVTVIAIIFFLQWRVRKKAAAQ